MWSFRDQDSVDSLASINATVGERNQSNPPGRILDTMFRQESIETFSSSVITSIEETGDANSTTAAVSHFPRQQPKNDHEFNESPMSLPKSQRGLYYRSSIIPRPEHAGSESLPTQPKPELIVPNYSPKKNDSESSASPKSLRPSRIPVRVNRPSFNGMITPDRRSSRALSLGPTKFRGDGKPGSFQKKFRTVSEGSTSLSRQARPKISYTHSLESIEVKDPRQRELQKGKRSQTSSLRQNNQGTFGASCGKKKVQPRQMNSASRKNHPIQQQISSQKSVTLGSYGDKNLKALLRSSPTSQGDTVRRNSLQSNDSGEEIPPLNFSYPRRNSTRSGSHDSSLHPVDSVSLGGDGQIDGMSGAQNLPFNRLRKVSVEYSPEAIRRLHGGVIPNIDLQEHRGSGRPRPPVTRRTSVQYSKVNNQALPFPPLVATQGTPLSRRASYSSVTGIEPTSAGNTPQSRPTSEPTNPVRIYGYESLRSNSRGLALDSIYGPQEVSAELPVPMGEASLGAYSLTAQERKRLDDFDFVNTLESASRPYTPDKFAVEAGMVNNSIARSTSRTSSKRTVRSLVSLSRRSLVDVTTPVLRVSSSSSRNVLRKSRPNSRDKDSEYNSHATEVGNRSISLFDTSNFFRRRTGSKNENQFSLEIPHTATTCAGPSKGIIKDEIQEESCSRQSITGSRMSNFSIPSFEGFDISQEENPEIPKIWGGLDKENRWIKRRESQIGEQISYSDGLSMTDSITDQQVSDEAEGTKNGSHGNDGVDFRGWNSTLDDVFEGFLQRRAIERSYRYGPAGRRIPSYMRGALEGQGEKSSSKIGTWMKSHVQRVIGIGPDARVRNPILATALRTSINECDSVINDEVAIPEYENTNSADCSERLQAPPMFELDGSPDVSVVDKQSAFVEHFDQFRKAETKIQEIHKRRIPPKDIMRRTWVNLKSAFTHSCS